MSCAEPWRGRQAAHPLPPPPTPARAQIHIRAPLILLSAASNGGCWHCRALWRCRALCQCEHGSVLLCRQSSATIAARTGRSGRVCDSLAGEQGLGDVAACLAAAACGSATAHLRKLVSRPACAIVLIAPVCKPFQSIAVEPPENGRPGHPPTAPPCRTSRRRPRPPPYGACSSLRNCKLCCTTARRAKCSVALPAADLLSTRSPNLPAGPLPLQHQQLTSQASRRRREHGTQATARMCRQAAGWAGPLAAATCHLAVGWAAVVAAAAVVACRGCMARAWPRGWLLQEEGSMAAEGDGLACRTAFLRLLRHDLLCCLSSQT